MINERIVEVDGFPVLFANVPNAGVARTATATKSGNPKHDVRSGKFGGGGGGGDKPGLHPPANVDPHEWHRMLAAVRDAAREFDHPAEADIKEFLKGRVKDVGQVDLAGFVEMVRHQRLSDLADLLDQQFRARGPMKQGRRKVRVAAPRGFLRKALKDLTPEDVKQLVDTIVSRGHDQADVQKWFDDKDLGTTPKSG